MSQVDTPVEPWPWPLLAYLLPLPRRRECVESRKVKECVEYVEHSLDSFHI